MTETPLKLTTGHPLVRQLFDIAAAHGMTIVGLARAAGRHENSVGQWRRRARRDSVVRTTPTLAAFDDCLNVLGYRLAIVPLETLAETPKHHAARATSDAGCSR